MQDYGTDFNLIPSVVDPNIANETRNCLSSGACYNTTCLSAVALEVLKRTCIAEIGLLTVEKNLYTQLKQLVEQKFKSTWIQSYTEWYNRNAFFFSKKPGKNIFKTEEKPTISSQLSLQNIKSITRKEVRGSRYELLANARGVTGASAGEWIYNIFFGGKSGSTLHPYYDQGYTKDSFISSRDAHVWMKLSDSDATDDPGNFGTFGPNYKAEEYVESSVAHIGLQDVRDIVNIDNFDELSNLGKAQRDLNKSPHTGEIKNTFRFYNTTEQNSESQ